MSLHKIYVMRSWPLHTIILRVISVIIFEGGGGGLKAIDCSLERLLAVNSD